MKFRYHRGSYLESMQTVIEVNSIEELRGNLKNELGEVAEFNFESMCFDTRNGWNTHLVMARKEGWTDFIVAGMSDGCLENETTKKVRYFGNGYLSKISTPPNDL